VRNEPVRRDGWCQGSFGVMIAPMSQRVAASAALLLLAAPCVGQADDLYRGLLHCGTIPDVVHKPLRTGVQAVVPATR